MRSDDWLKLIDLLESIGLQVTAQDWTVQTITVRVPSPKESRLLAQ